MPSPRWLARLTVPMMVGAALFTSAAIATADPVNDGYLAQLRAIGFTWPPGHETGRIHGEPRTFDLLRQPAVLGPSLLSGPG